MQTPLRGFCHPSAMPALESKSRFPILVMNVVRANDIRSWGSRKSQKHSLDQIVGETERFLCILSTALTFVQGFLAARGSEQEGPDLSPSRLLHLAPPPPFQWMALTSRFFQKFLGTQSQILESTWTFLSLPPHIHPISKYDWFYFQNLITSHSLLCFHPDPGLRPSSLAWILATILLTALFLLFAN